MTRTEWRCSTCTRTFRYGHRHACLTRRTPERWVVLRAKGDGWQRVGQTFARSDGDAIAAYGYLPDDGFIAFRPGALTHSGHDPEDRR